MSAFIVFNSSKGTYVAVDGTEDFVEVSNVGTGGYDWTEMGVYYSPSRRMYFWLSDSGCSCNSFGDHVTSLTAFENGDRDAALRAVKANVTVGDRYYGFTSEQRERAIRDVKTFDAKAARKAAKEAGE